MVRGGELVPVSGRTVLHTGDELLMLADPEHSGELTAATPPTRRNGTLGVRACGRTVVAGGFVLTSPRVSMRTLVLVAALWMLVNGSRLVFEHSERGRRRPGPPDAMILAPLDSVAPFTGLLLGQPTLRRRIKLGAFAAPRPAHRAALHAQSTMTPRSC